METAPATKVTCGASPLFASESRFGANSSPARPPRPTFHAERGEAYDQALALNDLGLACSKDDDFDCAMAALEQARGLFERAGDTLKQAQVLQNIGWVRLRTAAASRRHCRATHAALALLQPEQDPTLYATILSNSALASTFVGDHDTALRQLSQALALSRAVQDKWWQVTILDNIGLVYDRIGEDDLALDFYGQSLALGSAALISSGRRNTLAKTANILRDKGEYDRALTARKEALALAPSPSSRSIIPFSSLPTTGPPGASLKPPRYSMACWPKVEPPLSDYVRALVLLERGQLAPQGAPSRREVGLRGRDPHLPMRSTARNASRLRRLDWREPCIAAPRRDKALKELQRTLRLAEELRRRARIPNCVRSSWWRPGPLSISRSRSSRTATSPGRANPRRVGSRSRRCRPPNRHVHERWPTSRAST